MPRTSISTAALTDYLGKSMSDLCEIGYDVKADNHCAHFVSHVMDYSYGAANCANLTWDLKQAAKTLGQMGRTVRVDDLFKRCPEVGSWGDKPDTLATCLAFITKKSAVSLKDKTMKRIPQKHVGIFAGGKVWHYSNAKDKVVNQTPEQFENHYGSSESARKTYALYFGKLPR